MSKKKTYETNEDFLTDRFVSELTDIGLNEAKGVQARSDVELNDSMAKMTRFLENDASEPTGFEFIYDHVQGQTHMNVLAESADTSIFHEFGDLNNVNMIQDYDLLQNLTEDTYVAGANIRLDNDYWHSLDVEETKEFDPLRKLMYEMSKEGVSNVTTALQATVHPIPSDKWNKRYSFQSLFGRLLLFPITFMIFAFNFFISLFDSTKADPADAMIRIFDEVIKIFTRLTGYSRRDFIDSYVDKQAEIEGSKDTDSILDGIGSAVDKFESAVLFGRTQDNINYSNTNKEKLANDLYNVIELAKHKSGSRGFVTDMRLILIGDDKQEVERKINKLKETYETIYNPPENDASVQQRLVVDPVQSEAKMKELIIDIGQRKTGVDKQGEVRDEYEWKALKTTRKRPMVLTPDELSVLVHIPSDEVKDKSIERKDVSIESGSDKFTYDID
jgi:hypothetical protein